jgi:hypothetical protein
MDRKINSDLLGLAELARFFRVTKPTAISYSRRTDFPEPLVRLAAGPVWERRGVEQWAAKNPPKYAVRHRRD